MLTPVFLLLCAALPPAAAQQGPVFYVSPAGNDLEGDGTAARPWATLSAAAAAVPGSGAEVVVADGLYRGRLHLLRRYAGRVVFRAAHSYRAILEGEDDAAISAEGAGNFELAGFEVRRRVRLAETTDAVLRDNIIHDSLNGDPLQLSASRNILVIGNSLAGQRVEVTGCTDVTVRDNVFSNARVVLRSSVSFPESRRAWIAGNVFLNREGGFILLGEDGQPLYGAQDVLIENNLMAGEAPHPPLRVHAARNVVFRNNTIASGRAATVRERGLQLANNLWLEPPASEIVLPRWTGEAFLSGASSIRQEFIRLVELYGTPDPASPAAGGAVAEEAPPADILDRQRDSAPDLGALELGAPPAPFRLLLIPRQVVGGFPAALSQVILDEPAGPAGALIRLSGSEPALVAAPEAVLVPPGATSATFAITTGKVASATGVTITASLDGVDRTAVLALNPQGLRSLNLGPDLLPTGAASYHNLVLLDGEAPPEGLSVSLASSRPDLVSVPREVRIPAGASVSDYFRIATRPASEAAAVTVTASLGSSTVSAVLGLAPQAVSRAGGPRLVSEVSVSGVTATQAVITYLAPDEAPCLVKVSEGEDLGEGYRPVHDVNPELFPGANQDTRPGTVINGLWRSSVAGKRTVETARNGRKYSRALQNNTRHYFQITCGASQATGDFTTANIPFGNTYAEPLPTDPASKTGLYNYPSLDWSDRYERIIDPLTGTEIRKVTLPGDYADTTVDRPASACAGSNWSSAAACAAADGASATYRGAGRDVLYAPANFTAYLGANIAARINLSMRASISGSPSGDDKYIDVCLTINGSTCVTPWKPADLTTCGLSDYRGDCANIGSTAELDFWGAEVPFHGWVNSTKEGFLLKPRTVSDAYTISIDHIRFTARVVNIPGFPAHAGVPLCSTAPITDAGDGNTYYLCYTQSARRLYSIDVTNGWAYYLSPLTPSEIVFDQLNPRLFYGVLPADNSLLRGEWTASPVYEYSGSIFGKADALVWTTLTAPGYALKELLAAFDPRFNPEWQARVGPNRFGSIAIQNNKVVLQFQIGQDTAGWQAVFDPNAPAPPGSPGQGNIVAAYYMGQTPFSRFCTIHTALGDFSSRPWVLTGNGRPAKGRGYFAGPWQVKVRKPGGGPLTPTDTEFELVEFNGSYEPTDPTPSGGRNDLTIPAQPGDLFYYDRNANGLSDTADELLEIVSINRSVTPPRWTVRRGDQLQNSPLLANSGFESSFRNAFTLPEGAALEAVCRTKPLNRGGTDGSMFWNFEADPRGEILVLPGVNGEGAFPPLAGVYESSTGLASPQVKIHWNQGSHGHTKIDQGVKVAFSGVPDCQLMHGKNACWAIQTGSGVNLVNSPVAYQSSVIPPFSGALPPGASNTYQSHPSYLQVNAEPAEKRWAFDVLPLSYGTGVYGTTASPEPGTASVYKVSGATLHRKHLGTLATCGERALRDLSSSSAGNLITDSTPYTYCFANAAGECRDGSSPGDVYVSCPGRTQTSCAVAPFSVTYPSTVVDVCVGDSWAFGHGIVQVPLAANSIRGERTRVIAYPFPIPHLQSIYSSAKALPDGKWALYLGQRHERADVYLVKMPPYPEPDQTDRGNFVRIPISIPPPPVSGADNVIVEFGYAENGAAAGFHCTTRKEACVAGRAEVDLADPFYFVSESPPGVPCATGCAVELPALSQRVLYYRVKYRDAGKNVMATGVMQAAVVP